MWPVLPGAAILNLLLAMWVYSLWVLQCSTNVGFTGRLLQCGFIPCGFYNVLRMWVLQAGYCNVGLFPVGPAAKSGQFKVVTSQTLPS